MTRCHRTALVLGLLALSGAPLAGQQIRSPYRFIDTSQFAGAFGGQMFASSGRLDLGPAEAPTFGVRWGIRLSGPLMITADIGYIPTTRAVRDTVFLPDSIYRRIGEADMNIITVLGNARLNITGARTWNRLQPFALAGAGAAIDIAGEAAADTTLAANMRYDFGTTFAAQLGAGVEWFATNSVSLRLDARSVFWKLEVPEAFRLSSRGPLFPASEWERNIVLSAGLSMHF